MSSGGNIFTYIEFKVFFKTSLIFNILVMFSNLVLNNYFVY